jgi:hypothetical protein
MTSDPVRSVPAVPKARREAASLPWPRRRAAALLALAPVVLLLAACGGMEPQRDRPHPRTDRNGQRGAR